MPLCPQITNTPTILPRAVSITAVTFTSTTATYAASGHTFIVGDVVVTSGLAPAGYNGTFTITSIVASTSFTVSNTTNATVTDGSGLALPGGNYVVTSVLPVVPATTTQVDAVEVTATTASTNASTALANAAVAYSAAIGSLQPSANTIVNASNQITAIASNGITVYSGSSATSGARVVMNSAGLAGYNSGGTATFAIVASTGAASFSGSITGSAITGSTLNVSGNCIIDATGKLTATGVDLTGAITATSGSFTGTITSNSGTIGGWNITSTQLYTGTLGSPNQYLNASGGALFTGTTTCSALGVNSNLTVGGTGTITGVFTAVDAGTTTNANTPNAWLSTGGVLRRSTASSIRYKENIVNLVDVAELDPKKLLDLPVRAFTYKEGYLPNTDDRYMQLFPGFISEEIDAIYPMAVDYENGQIESWNDRMILPAMLALIQDLYKEIKILKGE